MPLQPLVAQSTGSKDEGRILGDYFSKEDCGLIHVAVVSTGGSNS